MRGSGAVALALCASWSALACADATGPEESGPGRLSGRIVFAFDSTVLANVDVTIGAGSIAPDGTDRVRIAEVPGPGPLEAFLVAPGARRLALLRGVTTWTFRDDGRELRAAEALEDANPESWTPGGDRLLWLRPPPIFAQAVYTSAPDGTDRRFLDLPGFETLRHVRFLPARGGPRLVFEARVDNTVRDVWIAGATGANPRRLTDNRSNVQYPEPSPDGRRIAFLHEAGNTDEGSRVVGLSSVDAVEEDVVRLLTREELEPESTLLVLLARWSPSGNRIAAYSPAPRSGIWVVGADGDGPRLLWPDAGEVSGLAWSPAGNRIVVSRRADRHDDWDLVVIDVESGARADVTRTSGVHEVFPAWIP